MLSGFVLDVRQAVLPRNRSVGIPVGAVVLRYRYLAGDRQHLFGSDRCIEALDGLLAGAAEPKVAGRGHSVASVAPEVLHHFRQMAVVRGPSSRDAYDSVFLVSPDLMPDIPVLLGELGDCLLVADTLVAAAPHITILSEHWVPDLVTVFDIDIQARLEL